MEELGADFGEAIRWIRDKDLIWVRRLLALAFGFVHLCIWHSAYLAFVHLAFRFALVCVCCSNIGFDIHSQPPKHPTNNKPIRQKEKKKKKQQQHRKSKKKKQNLILHSAFCISLVIEKWTTKH